VCESILIKILVAVLVWIGGIKLATKADDEIKHLQWRIWLVLIDI
jgi:hypothetical protein